MFLAVCVILSTWYVTPIQSLASLDKNLPRKHDFHIHTKNKQEEQMLSRLTFENVENATFQ